MTGLAKSMLRFSWALSLFGARQALDVVTRRNGTAAGFEGVRYAAEGQMEGTFRSLFQAGDRLQRGLVDLTADLLEQTTGARRG